MTTTGIILLCVGCVLVGFIGGAAFACNRIGGAMAESIHEATERGLFT